MENEKSIAELAIEIDAAQSLETFDTLAEKIKEALEQIKKMNLEVTVDPD